MFYSLATLLHERQRFLPGVHITKSPHPHETIRIVEIAKLPDQLHPQRLLALDEFPFKEIDQDIPFAGIERVLAEFDHFAAVFARLPRR